MSNPTLLRCARLFDGHVFRDGAAIAIEDGRITALLPDDAGGHGVQGQVEVLADGFLAPGFVDPQVNGGGGIMLDGAASVARIATICAAHAGLGATGILPTLITDSPDATRRVIEAAIAAADAGVPGFLGLHLEGPHLDPRRCGAHDPALIRPMSSADLDLYLAAAAALPALIVTLAPGAADADQIVALKRAGAIVSLGHSDCTAAEADAAFAAGASMVTHLFNAMSPLSHRAPGLVGAALDGAADCGVIADGIHVDPMALRIALTAKRRGRIFLVSDAMAVAGTDLQEFHLGGRRVLRQKDRLVLEDGTLAGADLTLPRAVQVLVRDVGVSPEQALAMASRIPAEIIGQDDLGRLKAGVRADLVWLGDDLSLRGVWQGGQRLL